MVRRVYIQMAETQKGSTPARAEAAKAEAAQAEAAQDEAEAAQKAEPAAAALRQVSVQPWMQSAAAEGEEELARALATAASPGAEALTG
mmetsp:Transcript_24547/g.79272  ORF Transcript_24547/g.79272 Transcript_24547/m.79272 type:complete len:89 (+) Transcript_24547:835-1101(+)